jgi:hypothetical protein
MRIQYVSAFSCILAAVVSGLFHCGLNGGGIAAPYLGSAALWLSGLFTALGAYGLADADATAADLRREHEAAAAALERLSRM